MILVRWLGLAGFAAGGTNKHHGPAAPRVPFPVGAAIRGSCAFQEHSRISVADGDRCQAIATPF